MDPRVSPSVSQSASDRGPALAPANSGDPREGARFRALAKPALFVAVIAAIVGGALGAVFHPQPKYAYKAEALILIESTNSAERRAAVARLNDLRTEILLPHVAEAVRQQTGARGDLLERLDLDDGPGGGLRILVRDQSGTGAVALANAFAAQSLNFPDIESADVSLGDFETGLGQWGNTRSVFSLPPTAMRIVSQTPREGSAALRVVCRGVPGCGASLPVTYSFRRGITYTASAWLRSASGRAPIGFLLGANAEDYASGRGRLRPTWTRYFVRWTPARSATAAELSILLNARGPVTFDIDDVMLAEQRAAAGYPRGERTRGERALTVLPAVPSGTTGGETVRWALAGAGLGLLIAAASIALGRLARHRQ
jgi:Carbohydrate binding domain